MDFVSDSLENGRRMKVLTIVDLWDRRCPRLEADSSIPGKGVVRVLEQLRQRGECPKHLRSDNGPEFTGKALDRWATSAGVQLEFIQPGRPMENGLVESFDGKFREECLNAHAGGPVRGGVRLVDRDFAALPVQDQHEVGRSRGDEAAAEGVDAGFSGGVGRDGEFLLDFVRRGDQFGPGENVARGVESQGLHLPHADASRVPLERGGLAMSCLQSVSNF